MVSSSWTRLRTTSHRENACPEKLRLDGHRSLSITHKLSTDGGSQLDISESRQTSPHDQVARWRISSPGEITTQLCDLGQICRECLSFSACDVILHQGIQEPKFQAGERQFRSSVGQ